MLIPLLSNSLKFHFIQFQQKMIVNCAIKGIHPIHRFESYDWLKEGHMVT